MILKWLDMLFMFTRIENHPPLDLHPLKLPFLGIFHALSMNLLWYHIHYLEALFNLKFSVVVDRAYISAARKLSPSIPRELEEYIATAYSSIRQEEAKSNTPTSYTTVRTLLSILRISAVSFFVFLNNIVNFVLKINEHVHPSLNK